MSVRVVAEFPAAPGKLEELIASLKAALTDKRAFVECEDIESLLDADRETIVLVEHWRSFEDYDRYIAWRVETGMLDLLISCWQGAAPASCPANACPPTADP